MIDLEALKKTQADVLAQAQPGGALAPRDGKTFCNFALHAQATAMGYDGFQLDAQGDPPLMNAMIDQMAAELRFTKGNAEQAVAHAEAGGLAVASKKFDAHGHSATVSPEPMRTSGTLGHPVPMVVNVGHSVGVMLLSGAFPVYLPDRTIDPAWEPAYFLLDA